MFTACVVSGTIPPFIQNKWSVYSCLLYNRVDVILCTSDGNLWSFTWKNQGQISAIARWKGKRGYVLYCMNEITLLLSRSIFYNSYSCFFHGESIYNFKIFLIRLIYYILFNVSIENGNRI